MKIILALLLILILPACATTGGSKIEQVKVRSAPKAGDVIACVKPGDLESGDLKSVILKLNETAGLLNECADKKERLVEYIKKEFSEDVKR